MIRGNIDKLLRTPLPSNKTITAYMRYVYMRYVFCVFEQLSLRRLVATVRRGVQRKTSETRGSGQFISSTFPASFNTGESLKRVSLSAPRHPFFMGIRWYSYFQAV